ncbi:MAG: hypothetical protein ABII12_15605, partial [Planctomycetota bacterium]
DDYATKPIDRKKLIETIREWLPKESALEKERALLTGTHGAVDAPVSGLTADPGVAELAEKCITELPDKVAAIEKLLAENDLDVLSALAHRPKE